MLQAAKMRFVSRTSPPSYLTETSITHFSRVYNERKTHFSRMMRGEKAHFLKQFIKCARNFRTQRSLAEIKET